MGITSPRPPEWKSDWDEMRGKPTGELPFCPNCHELLYNLHECCFCGQVIATDEKMIEFAKPPDVKHMDCIICGGVNTVTYVESSYNGHKRGECRKCGMRFIE